MARLNLKERVVVGIGILGQRIELLIYHQIAPTDMTHLASSNQSFGA